MRCAIAVICTLAEHGLVFRETNEKFGFLQKWKLFKVVGVDQSVRSMKFATLIFQNAEVSPTAKQLTCLGITRACSKKFKRKIMFACAAHSLNLVGRSAVDCCPEAVNFFFIVQLIYTFFSASTNRWKILKRCLGDEKVLKSLSDTRCESHAIATEAILKSFPQILEALECLQEDHSQKGDTRREAENIANKMQELEFAFMLIFWEEILQHFHSRPSSTKYYQM